MNDNNLNNLNNLNNVQESNTIEVLNDKPKKKNKMPLIIFIILMVIILGLVGYIVFDKVLNNKKEENENVVKESIIDTSSDLVNQVFNRFTDGYLSDCNNELEMYFNNKEIQSKDIKNRDAFNIAMNLVSKESNDLVISGDMILDKVKSLYGDDYTFTNQTYDSSIIYSSETNSYTINMLQNTNSCSNSVGNMSKITTAKSIGNDLELEVRVIFKGTNKYIYYSDFNRSKILNSIGDLKIENDSLYEEDFIKGDLYKIIFTKVNDNYIFKSSKLVSETPYNSKEIVIDDMEAKTILDENINIIEVMSQNKFIVSNLYKDNITSITDQEKLLSVLMYLYQAGKFTSVITPSDNISYFISNYGLTNDKLVGSINLVVIKDMYDDLYSSLNESLDSKEKFNYTSSCPIFVYDTVNKAYYAYMNCNNLNTIRNIGYTYKYSIIGDKINVYRSVGYKENNIVYTSFKTNASLNENESKNFNDINSTNNGKFDKFLYQFSLDNAHEFKFVSVTN